MSYTVAEDFTLPSLGKIYKVAVNPNIKLRSMTTEEEMLRLSQSERPYKLLCDIIDGCIVGDKPGISAYDMCLGDYQFLLHRLRVVTYGPEYHAKSLCPYCGYANETVVNLDDMPVLTYTEDLDKYFEFSLPKSGNLIKIKLQTPRSVDDIAVKVREDKKKNPLEPDKTLLFTLKDLIEKVDGVVYDPVKIDIFARKLPMADTNYILKCAEKLNKSIGIDTNLSILCRGCGVDYDTPFRVNADFFGPRIDI